MTLFRRFKIEQDFAEKFLSADKIFTVWPTYAWKIIDYGIARCPSWSTLLDVSDITTLSQEEQEVLAFSMLPLICRGRAKGMRGKCSFKCSLEAFIDLKPEGTDLEYYINQIDRKTRPQPFILIIGGSRTKPLQTFVIVERQGVLCSTMTKAIDYALKLHYVLDVVYQEQCFAAWQFLQSVVYQLPGDATSSSVPGVTPIVACTPSAIINF
ncbi:uncharacterized protein [Amphiura filiformis]|uniref:uncharacterized protein n=1 Tax=Amphiura filiformis TaxID=82378 RepID=UPI003B215A7F